MDDFDYGNDECMEDTGKADGYTYGQKKDLITMTEACRDVWGVMGAGGAGRSHDEDEYPYKGMLKIDPKLPVRATNVAHLEITDSGPGASTPRSLAQLLLSSKGNPTGTGGMEHEGAEVRTEEEEYTGEDKTEAAKTAEMGATGSSASGTAGNATVSEAAAPEGHAEPLDGHPSLETGPSVPKEVDASHLGSIFDDLEKGDSPLAGLDPTSRETAGPEESAGAVNRENTLSFPEDTPGKGGDETGAGDVPFAEGTIAEDTEASLAEVVDNEEAGEAGVLKEEEEPAGELLDSEKGSSTTEEDRKSDLGLGLEDLADGESPLARQGMESQQATGLEKGASLGGGPSEVPPHDGISIVKSDASPAFCSPSTKSPAGSADATLSELPKGVSPLSHKPLSEEFGTPIEPMADDLGQPRAIILSPYGRDSELSEKMLGEYGSQEDWKDLGGGHYRQSEGSSRNTSRAPSDIDESEVAKHPGDAIVSPVPMSDQAETGGLTPVTPGVGQSPPVTPEMAAGGGNQGLGTYSKALADALKDVMESGGDALEDLRLKGASAEQTPNDGLLGISLSFTRGVMACLDIFGAAQWVDGPESPGQSSLYQELKESLQKLEELLESAPVGEGTALLIRELLSTPRREIVANIETYPDTQQASILRELIGLQTEAGHLNTLIVSDANNQARKLNHLIKGADETLERVRAASAGNSPVTKPDVSQGDALNNLLRSVTATVTPYSESEF